jgi:protein-L-isoaspartate(D-aspartate) O-methyltransferase
MTGVTGAEARRRYAEELIYTAHLTSPAVIEAFARVPRERFLGPGPWRIYQSSARSYWTTADADPRHLYHDVLVAIDEARRLNNGQPSFLAFLIQALDVREGDHAVHVGAGTGYFTAILAELVGPSGRVTATEVDADLALRSRSNLADRPNVVVLHADGGDHDPGPADAIMINAGATHARPVWLDALRPGGRMLLPLTGPLGHGGVLKVVRGDAGYAATWVSSIAIFPCAGARDEATAVLLRDAFLGGGGDAVRSLRRDPHERESTCWLHREGFCLSTAQPAGESPGAISSR